MKLLHLERLEEEGGVFERIARFLGPDPTSTLKALPLGRHSLEEGLWVNRENPNGRAKALYESHKRYADLQITLAGDETIITHPLTGLSPAVAYDEEKDIAFWHFTQGTSWRACDGKALLLLPDDAHAPCMGEGVIEKAVFKIALDLLN